MKAFVFLSLACLLLAPSVAADPGPTPCRLNDTECWWAWTEDNTPLPLCDHTWVPFLQRVCDELDPDA